MRNLKRALSLTLASVMLLGMMVVGSSAAAGYDDVDVNDNVEAIEVLQAVQVMVGDDRGFGPDRPVTRNEMAVVMGKLLNLDYNYYSEACPFTDVADWAKGWVGAAAANGIVSGRGNGIYDGEATVTAVEAASMMMRALGYFKYQNDYADGFQVATVRQGTKIGIFDQVGTDATTAMTRNQVAQMALNALKSGMVEPDGNTINLTTPDGSVFTGKVNYVYVTSAKDFAHAISWTQATSAGSTNTGYIVELGEQLYDGKLKLEDGRSDDFLRPSRKWEYDGKAIGTYMKTELIKQEYTTEVTGRDLYDLLGADVVNSVKKGGSGEYTLNVAIDGEDDVKVNDQLFDITSINKNNKAKVGDTGNGALTQVFVNGDDKIIDITIVNTYLARARADYSEKKDEVSFNVYGIDKDGDNYIKVVDTRKSEDKGNDNKETMTVNGDDFTIDGIKENDAYLVTVADGAIKSLSKADMVEDTTLTSFKKNDNVVADGVTYKYATTAEYDFEVLDVYTGDKINLKEKNYNVYLDKYGYLIGIDLVTVDDNYVFITGIDDDNSNLAATNNEANAIFLDGTMEQITFNVAKSSSALKPDSLVNTWCTYTKDSKGIYTLTQVAAKTDADASPKVKVAQSHDTETVFIDVKHVSLKAAGTDFAKAYGNDDTVYLTAELYTINDKTHNGRQTAIINKVANVTTGVKNASLEVWNTTETVSTAKAWAEGDKNADKAVGTAVTGAYGTYVLYKDNGYVIAAVTVADDSASSKNLVYVTSDDVEQESYDSTSDEWTWTREVAIKGEKSTIKEVSDNLTYISGSKMKRYNWYEVKYNAEGEVILVTLAQKALDNATGAAKAQGNEYVHRIDWVEGSVNAKDTVLFENSRFDGETPTISTTEQVNTDGPSMKGNTFYVNTTDKTGFNVMDDVKVVFIQKNDNKTTTTWESGSDELEDFVGDLNKNANGKYDYEVSAILEGGRATTVVLRDLNGTGDGGKTPTGKVTGAKAAITGAADTLTGGSTVDEIKIGYLTEKDEPKDVNDIQAVIEDWAKENNYTLGARTAIAGSGYSWECFDRYGTKQGAVKVVTNNITQGVRVNYIEGSNSGYGYEIEALDWNTATSANDANNNAKKITPTAWTQVDDGNGLKWLTAKTDPINVTGHDWEINLNAATARVTLDGNYYYGTAGTTNVAAATGAIVKPAALKAGDNIKVDKSGTITFITKSDATTTQIADGDVYDSGYVKIIKDTTNIASVAATGVVKPTADTDQYYVPAGASITVTLKAAADAKHFQLTDASGSYGQPFTAADPDGLVMPATKIGAKDVTLSEVQKITLPATVGGTPTGSSLSVEWYINGVKVSAGDNYCGKAATDKIVAKVKFGTAFTPADADDNIEGGAGATATGDTTYADYATTTATLKQVEIPTTAEFTFTWLGNGTNTYSVAYADS